MDRIKYTLSCILVLVMCNGVVCASSTSACDDYCQRIGYSSGTVASSNNQSSTVTDTKIDNSVTVSWTAGSASCTCSSD